VTSNRSHFPIAVISERIDRKAVDFDGPVCHGPAAISGLDPLWRPTSSRHSESVLSAARSSSNSFTGLIDDCAAIRGQQSEFGVDRLRSRACPAPQNICNRKVDNPDQRYRVRYE
jgi:hypothetical protein